MATKRMLVDAIHPEETRIVVTSGNKLEEFDFESAQRRQLRGNIYLAKVTRVEPSLQAAFIEYGGNRHGFLAFSEIHPDYYQIPVADREALMRDEEEAEREEHASAEAESIASVTDLDNMGDDAAEAGDDEAAGHSHIEQAPANAEPVESIGGSDAMEDVQERRQRPARRHQYKIQEVIKRRQVMLVQVVKEERGNKGAALTTYLSLAGRYSVLMPNTARGGGISRKITNAADRKRLKDIVGDLEVPQGQGIILRTAGASRTKAEVKRDFEYLQRLWENVRSLTLKSQAPCLVYEEGSLIKRTIRDLYSKEIDELYVAGDEAFREAKDFMRMIMPSHAKNVQLYKDDQPLFSKFGVESQLDSMFSPQVTLPSGGYVVINPTEALVSIDVNSGRATKEHNIEDTALQTNLEAADEVARQLRLRDLAGLIVIDFIDMMENRSNRAVERRLKDALKNDRARIQVGRISHFGLMEMSRQRIRFGVVESSTHKCPTCQGTGIVRSVESLALMVMRAVEDHVLRKAGQSVNVRVPVDVALYILNSKRVTLNTLEAKYGLSITLIADDHVGGNHYAIEKGEPRAGFHAEQPQLTHVRVDTAAMDEADDANEVDVAADEDSEASSLERPARAERHDGEGGDRNRRRRRNRGGERGERHDEHRQPRVAEVAAPESDDEEPSGAEGDETPRAVNGAPREDNGDEPRKRRRRGRRGGRRNNRGRPGENGAAGEFAAETGAVRPDAADAFPAAGEPAIAAPAAVASAEAVAEKPKRARRGRTIVPPSAEEDVAEGVVEGVAEAPAPVETPTETTAKPKRVRAKKPKAEATDQPPMAAQPEAAPVDAAPATTETPRRPRRQLPPDEIVVVSNPAAPTVEEAPKPKKAGWWQRGFLG